MTNKPAGEYEQALMLAMDAADLLTSSDVENLEKLLEADPRDISSRIRLIGYYTFRRFEKPGLCEKRMHHIAWLVQNNSDHPLLGSIFAAVSSDVDGPFRFDFVGGLWLALFDQQDVTNESLFSAARYFEIERQELAERFFMCVKDVTADKLRAEEELLLLWQRWRDR